MQWTFATFVMLATLGCGASVRESAAPLAPAAQPFLWGEGASPAPPLEAPPPPAAPPRVWPDPMVTLAAATERASPGGRRVLEATRAMLDAQTVVRGSCYDWVNAVYHRAGGRPAVIYHGSRRDPYVDGGRLQPGDWVSFINHSFGDVTHAALFVAWADEGAHDALMVSYPGGGRDAPGRLGDYRLTNVYQVVRMNDEPPPAPAAR